MSQRFSPSVRDSAARKRERISCRSVVLEAMRLAGFENDRGRWMRLYIENPIGRTAADDAWAKGQRQRKEKERCDSSDP